MLGTDKQRILDCSATDARQFIEVARNFGENKSFIKTREGHIGLAPRTAQPRDQICVLLGCNRPLLLRLTPNLQCQVVGGCYIHGLMYGEVFPGPHPDYW